VRDSATLACGRHLFVDDLVILRSEHGKGHGEAMLRYLTTYAHQRGLTRIYLDSRDTAAEFYR
jgi:GNAT superfamily N-acetyltransferase